MNLTTLSSIHIFVKSGLEVLLNPAEHEIYPAHKFLNANNCWHFKIYKQDEYNTASEIEKAKKSLIFVCFSVLDSEFHGKLS